MSPPLASPSPLLPGHHAAPPSAVALLATVGGLNLVGAVGGVIAMIVGQFAANGFLFVRARRTALNLDETADLSL